MAGAPPCRSPDHRRSAGAKAELRQPVQDGCEIDPLGHVVRAADLVTPACHDTMINVSSQKCGPPESRKHVPPSPMATGFPSRCRLFCVSPGTGTWSTSGPHCPEVRRRPPIQEPVADIHERIVLNLVRCLQIAEEPFRGQDRVLAGEMRVPDTGACRSLLIELPSNARRDVAAPHVSPAALVPIPSRSRWSMRIPYWSFRQAPHRRTEPHQREDRLTRAAGRHHARSARWVHGPACSVAVPWLRRVV